MARGASCCGGVAAGWRSCAQRAGVVLEWLTSRRRGDGVAWLTVRGLGRDVGGNERNKTKQRKKRKKTKTKKTTLNKVISHAGGVGGNAGLVGSELVWWWTLVLVVEVDGDRGHEFMARRQGSCSGDVVCRARCRLAYRDGMASGRSFCAAGYQWWRLMVTGPTSLRVPGSWGVSHGGVMVENLRQRRGVWADVWRGGDGYTNEDRPLPLRPASVCVGTGRGLLTPHPCFRAKGARARERRAPISPLLCAQENPPPSLLRAALRPFAQKGGGGRERTGTTRDQTPPLRPRLSLRANGEPHEKGHVLPPSFARGRTMPAAPGPSLFHPRHHVRAEGGAHEGISRRLQPPLPLSARPIRTGREGTSPRPLPFWPRRPVHAERRHATPGPSPSSFGRGALYAQKGRMRGHAGPSLPHSRERGEHEGMPPPFAPGPSPPFTTASCAHGKGYAWAHRPRPFPSPFARKGGTRGHAAWQPPLAASRYAQKGGMGKISPPAPICANGGTTREPPLLAACPPFRAKGVPRCAGATREWTGRGMEGGCAHTNGEWGQGGAQTEPGGSTRLGVLRTVIVDYRKLGSVSGETVSKKGWGVVCDGGLMWEEGFMFASNLCLLIAVLWAKGRSCLPWLHENAFEREPDRRTPRGEEDEIVYEAWQEFVARLRGRLDETSHQQHLRNAQMSQRKCDQKKEWKKNRKTTMHKASEGKRNDRFGIIVSDAETKLNLSGKQHERLLRVV
ncbi:hypothetical protein EDB85DRAFT_2274967 [Lactarius pseudohatsudake]|nr:hypothetical protein EDB85DRAFT_2274967 [Lactarius pseudohatsudake]